MVLALGVVVAPSLTEAGTGGDDGSTTTSSGPAETAATGDDSGPSLTLWMRDTLPTAATAEQIKNGLTYREIPEGTLVGVVRFDNPHVGSTGCRAGRHPER